MFKIFKKNKNKYDILLQNITHISDTMLELLKQNSKILEEQAELRLLMNTATPTSSDEITKRKKYTSYEKGTFNKPKAHYFDSPAEKVLEKFLNHICQKYELGKNWGIRLLSHQPLINYVEMTTIKTVNSRNALMHFDFLFEARKLKDNEAADDRDGHFPLLAIELDGKSHDAEEQKERDSYKQGICDKLHLPLIRIKYDEEDFSLKKFEAQYTGKILTSLFASMFNQSLSHKNLENEAKIELLTAKQNEILAKYPNCQFPEIQQFVNDAFKIYIN